MRLNLGCGADVRQDYVNVDFRQTDPSVVVVDLSKFPWPFETESAEEILMLDFLEHFPYASTPFILLECYRVLAPNGTVVIQVPDARHLMRAVTHEGDYLCNSCGGHMFDEDLGNLVKCPKCGQQDSEIAEAAMRRLYGGQDYAGNFHQTCFTESSLLRKTAECGLALVQFEEIDHQWKNWNIRARFRRGDIW